MKIFLILVGMLAMASPAFPQSDSPSSAGATNSASTGPGFSGRVSYRGVHLASSDLEAQRRFWVDMLGATASKAGVRDVYTLRNIVVVVEKGSPPAGSEGSVIDHIGLRVRNLKDLLAKVNAQGYTIQAVNPNKDKPKQAIILGPDNVRMELIATPELATIAENEQVHYFASDAEAQQKWYVVHFGAVAKVVPKAKAAVLPGVTLVFSPAKTPLAPTKGRSLDRIGLEVKDLEAFCKTLEADGVKLETRYQVIPGLGFGAVYLTDPWGGRIELTEHPAIPAPQ